MVVALLLLLGAIVTPLLPLWLRLSWWLLVTVCLLNCRHSLPPLPAPAEVMLAALLGAAEGDQPLELLRRHLPRPSFPLEARALAGGIVPGAGCGRFWYC